jgi:recombination protein U
MKQDVVTPEQAERLDRHYKLGASCWVVVSYKFRTYARIPWDVWRKMKGRYGRKYITEQEAEEYKIPLIDGIVAFLD